VREASKYYEQAFAKAWLEIQGKLEAIKRRLDIQSVHLERVSYDRDSYISRIEELPDEPKAPQPDQVRVRVGIEAVYRIVR